VTPFGHIIRRAVEAIPDAIGGAFAASDGELVDSFANYDDFEWAVLTAQYGVVLSLLHAAFGTLHFGGHEFFYARHAKMDVVVCSVDAGYYALLAMRRAAEPDPDIEPFTDALPAMTAAVRELRREMS
jgi:hypothetical protein